MANTIIGTASYKGRTYNLLYIGDTKFGRRARLAFSDGSKDFWVDASLVSNISKVGKAPAYMPAAGRSSSRSSRTCRVCGGNDFNQVDCGECA